MSAFNQDSGAKLLAALKRGIENITLNVLNENPRDYHKRGRVIRQDEWGWILSIDNATYTRIPSLERVADYKQGDVVEVMIPNGQPSNMFIMGRLGGVVSSVSQDGVISWTNDGGKTNPTAVNIKGPQGATGTVALTASGIISGDTSSLVVGEIIPIGQLTFNRTPIVGDNFICLIKDTNTNREYLAGMQVDNWGTAAISKRGKVITLTEIAVSSLIFPVDSIYISYGDTSPASFIPNTTWEKITDRFLVGAGNLYEAGSTGGSKDAVVVAHTHNLYLQSQYYTEGPYGISFSTSEPNFNPNSSRKTDTAGVDGTDRNLPPYLAVNIWKRVS